MSSIKLVENNMRKSGQINGEIPMTRQQLLERSIAQLRETLRSKLPPHTPVYLFGSRAREDHRWNSDFDFWIDADLAPSTLAELDEQIEESFIPFHVDLVTTAQLAGRFGEIVRNEAKRWM
jgi:predicted nucleotidyltransferase